jgi:hypothetical protein
LQRTRRATKESSLTGAFPWLAAFFLSSKHPGQPSTKGRELSKGLESAMASPASNQWGRSTEQDQWLLPLLLLLLLLLHFKISCSPCAAASKTITKRTGDIYKHTHMWVVV